MSSLHHPTIEHPRVLYRCSQCEPYVIQLDTRGTYWSQYAYQFSHEFCHILSGYEHLKENPNQWFHETVCELASVFSLRRMAERWPIHPPYPKWADYSDSLMCYINESDVEQAALAGCRASAGVWPRGQILPRSVPTTGRWCWSGGGGTPPARLNLGAARRGVGGRLPQADQTGRTDPATAPSTGCWWSARHR